MDKLTLIDSDVLIDVSRDVTTAIKRIESEEQYSILAISVITQMKLFIECRNENEMRVPDHF